MSARGVATAGGAPALLGTSSLIGGAYTSSAASSRRALVVLNPADGGVVLRLASVSSADRERAVAAAAAAFPPWRDAPQSERAAVLKRWAALLREEADYVARILTLENGKPTSESLAEVSYAASYIDWYASIVTQPPASTFTTSPAPSMRGYVTREPIGVVVVITPFNLPVAMAARKVAAAIAAGCTVVVKPSEETPLTTLMLAALATRAGLPAGVLNVVVCRREESEAVVTTLLRQPAVKGVSLTGGCRAGRAVGVIAAERVLRTAFELGSAGAFFVVFDDADVDKAVAHLMAAKFRCAGQTCIAADRVLVQAGVHDEFVQKLAEKVRGLGRQTGNGLAEGVEMGPMINATSVVRVARLVDDAVANGAVVEVGGIDIAARRRHEAAMAREMQRFKEGAQSDRAVSSGTPEVVVNGVTASDEVNGYGGGSIVSADSLLGNLSNHRARWRSNGADTSTSRMESEPTELHANASEESVLGCFFPPTLVTGVTGEMQLYNREIFGPVVALRKFSEEAEAFEVIEEGGKDGGLAAYVYTESISRADRACRCLAAGMVAVNTVTLSDPRTPFGGVGLAGHAREGGPYGIDEFTYSKYILQG